LNLQVKQVGQQKSSGQPVEPRNRVKDFLLFFGWIKAAQAGPLTQLQGHDLINI